jgi:hypothetical protein
MENHFYEKVGNSIGNIVCQDKMHPTVEIGVIISKFAINMVTMVESKLTHTHYIHHYKTL